jgi:hypothetical protein
MPLSLCDFQISGKTVGPNVTSLEKAKKVEMEWGKIPYNFLLLPIISAISNFFSEMLTVNIYLTRM